MSFGGGGSRGGGGGRGGARGGAGGRGGAGDKKDQAKRYFFRRRKVCKFCADKIDYVDYKDVKLLSGFVPERGKILPRRMFGTCAEHQRKLTLAIQRARNIALLPFAADLLMRVRTRCARRRAGGSRPRPPHPRSRTPPAPESPSRAASRHRRA